MVNKNNGGKREKSLFMKVEGRLASKWDCILIFRRHFQFTASEDHFTILSYFFIYILSHFIICLFPSITVFLFSLRSSMKRIRTA